jgi:hypothetical protein
MPTKSTIIEQQTLCFMCVKTGEMKSSDNIIKFKMMLKLHLKKCDKCKYGGKILEDRSNTQKLQTISRLRHCDLTKINITAEERKGTLIHKWD